MSRLVAAGLAVRPRGSPAAPVVRDFSLTLESGEWVALTGANGGGKSTLALALAGLLPVAAGTIELDGAPLAPGRPRAGVGVILQEPSDQLLQATVADEIAFTARNLGHEERAIEAGVAGWSRALGLESLLDRDPRRLSAGEQQRVLLAAVMTARPGLLVADEAGAHLDPEHRGEWLRLLRAETRRGLAVLWVSQEPAELEAADRVIRIEPPAAIAAASPPADPAPALPAPGGTVIEVELRPPAPGAAPRISCAAPLRITLEAASITSVTGRNGAGKSLLLAAIAGLDPHPQVTCRWSAAPSWSPILVGQYPERQIFADTVAEEVAFAAVSRGRGREAVLEHAARLLDRLELPGNTFLGRRTWELSSGEKRLVEIVAGLVAPAPLLLLDEPTCGLDPNRMARLAGEITRGVTQFAIVLATQDGRWAESLGGKILRLDLTGSGGMPSPSKKTD